MGPEPNVQPIELSDEDIYFLLRQPDISNIRSIKSFVGHFKILFNLAEEYRMKRDVISQILPGRLIDDILVIGEMDETEWLRIDPQLAQLDMMAKLICENVEHTLEEAIEASKTIRIVLKDSLGVDAILRQN